MTALTVVQAGVILAAVVTLICFVADALASLIERRIP